MNGDRFERGDFLRKDSKKGSFMIYEGNNLSETTYKRMTVICFYDPDKMVMGAIGYENKPHLEIATPTKPCDTIDTEAEDYWIKKCSEEEKLEALRVLRTYNLFWDEANLALVDTNTGEIVKKIFVPDNTYYGQIIRPISEKFKELLKKWVFSKFKTTPTYPCCGGGRYGYGEEEYWD